MPGPLPKRPESRQRRNKSATRALLPPETAPIEAKPRLPKNPGGWEPLAKQWWNDVWTSPMRHEFVRADLGALIRLVFLVNSYYKTGELDVAREVRLMEREFGLTPFSRRRLEWTVTQAEDAREKSDQRRRRGAKTIEGRDPREALK